MSTLTKEQIINKLREFGKFTSDKEFADFIDVSKQRVYMWKKNNIINDEIVCKKFPDVSAEWIKTGEGAMFDNGDDDGVGFKVMNEAGEVVMVNIKNETSYIPIKVYNELKARYEDLIIENNKLEYLNEKLSKDYELLAKDHDQLKTDFINFTMSVYMKKTEA